MANHRSIELALKILMHMLCVLVGKYLCFKAAFWILQVQMSFISDGWRFCVSKNINDVVLKGQSWPS